MVCWQVQLSFFGGCSKVKSFCNGIVLIWKKRSGGKREEGLGHVVVQAILLFSHSFDQLIESHSFGMRIVTILDYSQGSLSR